MRPIAKPSPADIAIAAALASCRLLAVPLAVVHRLRLRHRVAVLRWLGTCPGGARGALRRIAFTRLARQVFKVLLLTGWGQAAVWRRVRSHAVARLPDGGCVLAVAHSPWGRVMARWTRARDFAGIFAHRRWARWAGPVHLPATAAGVRRAVAELARGRRVVVVVDDFVARGGCEVEFLGRHVRVSMRAVRLAASAGVPVVPVTLGYDRGIIHMEFGVPLTPGRGRAAQAETTRALLQRLARRTCRRPAEWNDLFHFFDAPPRTSPLLDARDCPA